MRRTLATLSVVLAACGTARVATVAAEPTDDELGACFDGQRPVNRTLGDPAQPLVDETDGRVVLEAARAVAAEERGGGGAAELSGVTALRGAPASTVLVNREIAARMQRATEAGTTVLVIGRPVTPPPGADDTDPPLVASIVLAARTDGRVAVIGRCQTDLTRRLLEIDVPTAYGDTHADVLRAALRDPFDRPAADLRARLGLPPRRLTFDETPADERQVISGAVPAAYAERVNRVTVQWDVPLAWRSFDVTFCPHTRLWLGECVSTSATSTPPHLPTGFVYAEPGQGFDARIHPASAAFEVLAPGVDVPAAIADRAMVASEAAVRLVGDPLITTRDELLRRGRQGPPPFRVELVANALTP